MFLESDGLIIRNAEAADAEILAGWWNDGKVMAHAGYPNGLGITARAVEIDLERGVDGFSRVLIIEAGKKPIGEMSYSRIEGDTAEIGIKICDTAEQGKGYGPRLLKMFTECLFSDYGFKRIALDTNLNNTRAQHVYEKLGFTRLRVNENAWRDQLGEWQSSVDYELVRQY